MTTMRAVVLERYGPPEQVLRLVQVPRPHPRPGEVMVRVAATALNSWDWDLLTGNAMGRVTGPFGPRHKVLGADVAGTIEAVGKGVTTLEPGMRVFGDLSEANWGGLAEYVVAPASAFGIIPQGLSLIDAAAIPQAGALALQALRKMPLLGPDHTVLINGAGGGVGTFAIQLAKPTGATIVGVDRAEKSDAVRALGAHSFIDCQIDDYTADPDRYDLIIDMVANRPASHYRRSLKSAGRLVVVGGTVRTLLAVALNSLGKNEKSLGLLFYQPSVADSLELAAKVEPLIDGVFPLERSAEALRRLGDGHAIGKVVVTV